MKCVATISVVLRACPIIKLNVARGSINVSDAACISEMQYFSTTTSAKFRKFLRENQRPVQWIVTLNKIAALSRNGTFRRKVFQVKKVKMKEMNVKTMDSSAPSVATGKIVIFRKIKIILCIFIIFASFQNYISIKFPLDYSIREKNFIFLLFYILTNAFTI